MTCWAAGMESWLGATSLRVRKTQDDLIDEYATRDDGGLNPTDRSGRDFRTLAEDFSIGFTVVAGSQLSVNLINTHLANDGHVLLIFNVGPGVAHTNVVYGVGRPDSRN